MSAPPKTLLRILEALWNQKTPALLIIIAAILASLPVKSWSEAYLCVSDKSTGFHFDEKNKEWQATSFGHGEKYIISRSKHANKGPNREMCRWCDDCYHHHLWMVQKFGQTDTVLAWCRDGYDTGSGKSRLDGFTGRTGKNDDYLLCDKSGYGHKLRFSKKTCALWPSVRGIKNHDCRFLSSRV